MKLELKHIAPYLPYGLKYGTIEKDWKTLEDYLKVRGELSTKGTVDNLNNHIDNANMRIILRPLSDLTTNMNDGHEYIELLNAMYGDSVTDFNFIGNRLVEHTSKDKGVTFDRIEYTNRTMPYYIMEFLFQHHFDVFDLIVQGLAIDVNTLEKINKK